MLLGHWEPTFEQPSAVRAERNSSAITNADDPFHGRYFTYGVEKTNSIRLLVAGNCIKSPWVLFHSEGRHLWRRHHDGWSEETVRESLSSRLCN